MSGEETPKRSLKVLTPLEQREQVTFLQIAADTGDLTAAAKAVGLNRRSLWALRKQDRAFDAAVLDAIDLWRSHLESHLYERAVEGIEEDVYNKDGDVIGTRVKRSDRLFELLLKRHCPEFRDTMQVEHNVSGGVVVVPQRPSSTSEWVEQHGKRPIEDSGSDL